MASRTGEAAIRTWSCAVTLPSAVSKVTLCVVDMFRTDSLEAEYLSPKKVNLFNYDRII